MKGVTLIINMYNDNKNWNSICKAGQYMRRREHEGNTSEPLPHLLWLGDFNCHHPLWDQHWSSHLLMWANLDRAQEVIDVMANYNFQMILPGGAPTLQALSTGNLTQTNNIFVSQELTSMVSECRTIP